MQTSAANLPLSVGVVSRLTSLPALAVALASLWPAHTAQAAVPEICRGQGGSTKLVWGTGFTPVFLAVQLLWGNHLRACGKPLDWYKRDPVHANARGEAVLGPFMTEYLAP